MVHVRRFYFVYTNLTDFVASNQIIFQAFRLELSWILKSIVNCTTRKIFVLCLKYCFLSIEVSRKFLKCQFDHKFDHFIVDIYFLFVSFFNPNQFNNLFKTGCVIQLVQPFFLLLVLMAWKSYIITTTIADAGTSRPGEKYWGK